MTTVVLALVALVIAILLGLGAWRFADKRSVFWTPAALLPGDHVRWEAVDNVTARVVVTYMGLQQAVDVTVGNNGQLSKVVFPRWSDANPAKTFQLQPFGGYLTEYRQFGAYRLPTRIEAGNFFETDDYFPFFKATVTSVRFPATNRKVGDDASD